MKVFGEELGAIGRWYIALPPLALIGFLVGLFVLAAAGQSRLNADNHEVYESQLRQQALSEFASLITDAETGQRGYLLCRRSIRRSTACAMSMRHPKTARRRCASYGY